MSEAMTAEGAVSAPARPTGAEVAPIEQPPAPQFAGEADPEIMSVLAKTQNKCFAEMGYFPTLLQEHHELQRQYALLRSDNQKLYADNYNLAQFIHAQDARMKDIRAPIEQSKRANEEMEGRLHAALNEIMLLRQELSRFIPSAVMVPAHERMMVQHPQQQVAQQRVVSIPAQQMIAQQTPTLAAYKQRPPQQHRAIQPLPAPRSHPELSPINTSAPPNIAYHRRTSAPVVMPSGAGPSSSSASPLGNFNGLSLQSPAPTTPNSSRPSTSGAPTSGPPPASRSVSGPVSSLHRVPQPQRVSTSSLAGAFIDLTADESRTQEGSRKRRKTDHGPEMAGSPAQQYPTQTATPITPSSWNPPDGYDTSVLLNASPFPSASTSDLPPVTSSQPPAVAEASAPLNTFPPQPPPGNDVAMEQQSSVEEDCLEANFDDDDEDENKLWCKMCRSRFKAGHTTEAPQPFDNVSQQELIAHCESVHPRGWEILKQKVSEQRAAESQPPT